MLAQLWIAEGIEAVLEVLSRSKAAREHELIHELHAQAVECERTAPQVAAQLDRVAGQLAEIHAGFRAAEAIDSLEQLAAWRAQVAWRRSSAMQAVLAAVAASSDPAMWPWRLERLPVLQAELDRRLTAREGADEGSGGADARGGEASPSASVGRGPPRVAGATARGDGASAGRSASRGDASSTRAVGGGGARDVASRPDAVGSGGTRDDASRLGAAMRGDAADAADDGGRTMELPAVGADPPAARGRAPLAALAELVELWHRLDPALDQTCQALVVEVAAGRCALPDALRVVSADDEPELAVQPRACLLMHLLEQSSPTLRRAALVAWTRLVASPEAQALEPAPRATLVLRWAVALELGWRVLPDPPAAFEGALRLLDHVRGRLAEPGPRLVREHALVRARLLRRLAGWRDGVLDEAVQAQRQALEALEAPPASPAGASVRGRVLVQLAALRRARRGEDPEAQDREVRALYDESLEQLRDSMVVRARALADYAVYLAQPVRSLDGDVELALALAQEAVAQLEGLPPAAREHPLLRAEEASHRITLGNLRLELAGEPLVERQAAATRDYHRALERLGDSDDVLAGLVHLDLACVALAAPPSRDRDARLRRAREELELAAQGLAPLPIAHARAVAERAMLAVRAAPDDEPLRERGIREVEAALQRLPLGADRVVRARVQRQLGELYLHRDGPEDLTRAAECFAAARGAFVEGGAVRLAVEAARDYAEAQLRQHADEADPAALLRGVVMLEQSALLAEQRWAARAPGEPLEELTAMLDGVYGDLAWLLAKLARPAEVVLHTVTRAKRYRAHPSLQALRMRAERSSMLSPVYVDPLARRFAPQPVARRAATPSPLAKPLVARATAFAAANPGALALDLTLTRWGTVAVAVSAEGLAYTTVPLSRETVRRWVWGDDASGSSAAPSKVAAPGWWARYLAHRDALDEGDEARAAAHERAWAEAGGELALELGSRLLEPIAAGLDRTFEGRVLLLAPGRLSGLPFAAARVGGGPLVAQVKGLAQIASLAELPAGPLPSPRPRRALCVLADPGGPGSTAGAPGAPLEELHDVVRLLASGQAEVEVLARVGEAVGEAAFRPTQARTRERAMVRPVSPTIDAVLDRLSGLDHLFHGGLGWGLEPRAPQASEGRDFAEDVGLALLDAHGRPATLDAARIAAGPRWAPGSSVLLSAATRRLPPADDAAAWSLVRALHDAGVGLVILATCPVPPELARELCRGFYLYWALGRGPLEAFTAALANLAGSDPSRIGGLVASLGATEPARPSTGP